MKRRKKLIDITAKHNPDTDKWEVDLTGIKDDAEITIWLENFVNESETSYILSHKKYMLYRGRKDRLLKHIENHDKITRRLEIKTEKRHDEFK